MFQNLGVWLPSRVMFYSGENLFSGSRNIPISQHLTTLGLMRGGHQKDVGELYLTARGLGVRRPLGVAIVGAS